MKKIAIFLSVVALAIAGTVATKANTFRSGTLFQYLGPYYPDNLFLQQHAFTTTSNWQTIVTSPWCIGNQTVCTVRTPTTTNTASVAATIRSNESIPATFTVVLKIGS